MFAIWVDWEVLDWSQGPPDLNPCGWVCYLLCWEVRIYKSAFESAVHPLLELQQRPQEKPWSTYWLQGFFKVTFSIPGPRKVRHHGQRVSSAHSWKHFWPFDSTFSPSTCGVCFLWFLFVWWCLRGGGGFAGGFWFLLLGGLVFFQYLDIRSFPLCQENVAAFTTEEPLAGKPQKLKGSLKCSPAFRCRKQIALPLFPLSPEVFNTWLDQVRIRLT